MTLIKNRDGSMTVTISGYDLEAPVKDFFIGAVAAIGKSLELSGHNTEDVKNKYKLVTDGLLEGLPKVPLRDYITDNKSWITERLEEALSRCGEQFAEDDDRKKIVKQGLRALRRAIDSAEISESLGNINRASGNALIFDQASGFSGAPDNLAPSTPHIPSGAVIKEPWDKEFGGSRQTMPPVAAPALTVNPIAIPPGFESVANDEALIRRLSRSPRDGIEPTPKPHKPLWKGRG